jgi:hypothetical protein
VREPTSDGTSRQPADAPTPEAAKIDTSTDWDEWMEEHGGRPASRPDVADAEGKLRPAPRRKPEDE